MLKILKYFSFPKQPSFWEIQLRPLGIKEDSSLIIRVDAQLLHIDKRHLEQLFLFLPNFPCFLIFTHIKMTAILLRILFILTTYNMASSEDFVFSPRWKPLNKTHLGLSGTVPSKKSHFCQFGRCPKKTTFLTVPLKSSPLFIVCLITIIDSPEAIIVSANFDKKTDRKSYRAPVCQKSEI